MLSRIMVRSLPILLALAFFVAFGEVALACPTCKVALASHDASQGDIVSGYFWSILFMMSMPFTTIGLFSLYMYYEVRKARAQQAAEKSPSAPVSVGPSSLRTAASAGQ